MKSRFIEFESICKEIFVLNGFNVSTTEVRFDQGFDFLINTSDPKRKIAVEVKSYGSDFVSPKLLNRAAEILINSAKKQNIYEAIIAISSNISYDLREAIESTYNLSILDRADLFLMASKNPNIYARLKEIVESEIPEENKERGDVIDNIKNIPKQLSDEIKPMEPIREYCRELRSLPPGKDHWKQYELLQEDILKYLFGENLKGWHRQLWSDDELNRYDLVCRIELSNRLWDFIALELGSRYILFEFKNYQDEITQDQIFTTERYLLEKGKRTVGFIISRVGITENGLIATKGAMRENGKMLIVLDDDDICEMLDMRNNANDPTDYLFEKVDEFLLTLSR